MGNEQCGYGECKVAGGKMVRVDIEAAATSITEGVSVTGVTGDDWTAGGGPGKRVMLTSGNRGLTSGNRDEVPDPVLHCRISGDFFVGDEEEAEAALAAMTGILDEVLAAVTQPAEDAFASVSPVSNEKTDSKSASGLDDGSVESLDSVPSGGLDGASDGGLTALASRIDGVLTEHPEAITGVDARAIVTAFGRAVEDMAPEASALEAAAPEATDVAAPKTGVNDDGLLDNAEITRRWHWLGERLEIVVDRPRGPAEQMEIEDRWAQEVADGVRRPTLRIWNWASPAVVVGRFQAIANEVDLDAAAREGFAVVRRSTGGGAMFVRPQDTITTSLYVPLEFCEGLTVEQTFRLCDSWLVAALRSLGIPARFAGLNDIAGPVGKFGGSAERRYLPAAHGLSVAPTVHSSAVAASAHEPSVASAAQGSSVTPIAHGSSLTASAHSSSVVPSAQGSPIASTAHEPSATSTMHGPSVTSTAHRSSGVASRDVSARRSDGVVGELADPVAQRPGRSPDATSAAPESSLPEKSGGALLHHTTLAYDIDADLMTQVLRISKEKLVDKAVSSAKKRVDPICAHTSLTRDALVAALPGQARAFAGM
ncbi:lipoate--protein ligase family protein [Bifidobacterium choloepi]|uniref:BPL/LPL catalytic domain-containing protein n=1 Tax=Bifidobacterium choloepi TaxID=2614131 RepID=A0A6I5NNU9_9BIFI|nr:hypothetical protein [Bifidobacterium choloepi]